MDFFYIVRHFSLKIISRNTAGVGLQKATGFYQYTSNICPLAGCK